MDFNLIIERTFDVGLLIDILTNEHIFDSISEDGADLETLKFDVINEFWVSMVVDDVVIGVTNFRPMFRRTYDCHIHILPEHREHSLAAGDGLLNWCNEKLPNSTLYTNVPVFCENVKRFLLNFGFEQSGLIKQAWLKNGKRNDMWILTRGTACQQQQ